MFPHRFLPGRFFAPRYWPPRRGDRLPARPRAALVLLWQPEVFVPMAQSRPACLTLFFAPELPAALRADAVLDVSLQPPAAPALGLSAAAVLPITLRE